jgi:predicted AlkP superfamily phosphohydrolase/phosphomutase
MYDRVFIFEMSGPTLGFIEERLDHLPHFRRFMEQGASSKLSGPLQPMVAPSYAVLYTGRNPGKTAFFDSFRFPAGSYDRIPYSLNDLQGETFFQRLSSHGKRVGLLNACFTHPLPEIDGFVVSGDEGIGEDYACPPEVLRTLRDSGYSVPFGASYSPGRETAFLEHTLAVLEMRHRAMRSLFADGKWSFGLLTVHLYGELLHAFWKFYDRRHPDYRPFGEVFGGRDPFLEVLVRMDGLLGEMLEMAGPRGMVIAMGAWGHRLEHSTVHLNAILEREGYLKFKRNPASQAKHLMFRLGISASSAERIAHRLNLWKLFHYKVARGKRAAVTGATFLSYQDVDWSRTRAVAMGYLGQVFLNVRGHRPQGVVAPEDYEAERRELRRILEGLEDPRSGQPMVDRVWAREEIYSGEQITHAPDLIVHLKEGYSAHHGIAGGGKPVAASPDNHSSDHYNESIFMALGENIRRGRIQARLEDVAPTVLHALGVPIPPDHDGKVLPIFV